MEVYEIVLYGSLAVLGLCGVFLFFMCCIVVPNLNSEEFVEACYKRGVFSISSHESKQIATEIANTIFYSNKKNIVSFFNKAVSKYSHSKYCDLLFPVDTFTLRCRYFGINDLHNPIHRKQAEKLAEYCGFDISYDIADFYHAAINLSEQPFEAREIQKISDQIFEEIKNDHICLFYFVQANHIAEESIINDQEHTKKYIEIIETSSEILEIYSTDYLKSMEKATQFVKASSEIPSSCIEKIENSFDETKEKYLSELHSKGINELNSRENRNIALKIARQYGFNTTDATHIQEHFDLFHQKALKQHTQKTYYKAFIKHYEAIKEIGIKQNTARKIQDFQSAKEKRLYLLEREAAPLKQKIKLLQDAYKLAGDPNNMGLEKERDWASWGGAASAIGGPAAGVTIASNIQQENMDIQARNDLRIKSNAYYIYQCQQVEIQLKRYLDPMQEAIDQVKSMAEDNTSTDELFNKINVTSQYEILPSGIINLTLSLNLKKTQKIAETLPAVVDGVLLARFKQNENLLGDAIIILPFKGISTSKKTIKMNLYFPEVSQNDLTVEIFPHKLFLAESVSDLRCPPEYDEPVYQYDKPPKQK